ncbi:PTS ascorbate transporter subunit IIC [Piscibacillus halophilus]|uniref:PTS ascorbate transporter subunit IIC n=1 Tax=Piscibacillus halophilus TaxID=571933 RepID=UPI001588503A|nr:PTS ascorbate transporter subunit IIC [Piscibacillus halophilus]
MSSLTGVFDWDFFWGIFGFMLQLVAPFVMLIIGIYAVGLLIQGIVRAIRNRD